MQSWQRKKQLRGQRFRRGISWGEPLLVEFGDSLILLIKHRSVAQRYLTFECAIVFEKSAIEERRKYDISNINELSMSYATTIMALPRLINLYAVWNQNPSLPERGATMR